MSANQLTEPYELLVIAEELYDQSRAVYTEGEEWRIKAEARPQGGYAGTPNYLPRAAILAQQASVLIALAKAQLLEAEAGMSEYQVTAYVNVGEGNFSGYTWSAPIARVCEFTVKAVGVLHAAEGMFTVGNKMGCDIHGAEWPHDVRSLSVGDLIAIKDPDGKVTFLACESTSWKDIPEPTNPRTELAGSSATSRPARPCACGAPTSDHVMTDHPGYTALIGYQPETTKEQP